MFAWVCFFEIDATAGFVTNSTRRSRELRILHTPTSPKRKRGTQRKVFMSRTSWPRNATDRVPRLRSLKLRRFSGVFANSKRVVLCFKADSLAMGGRDHFSAICKPLVQIISENGRGGRRPLEAWPSTFYCAGGFRHFLESPGNAVLGGTSYEGHHERPLYAEPFDTTAQLVVSLACASGWYEK